MSEQSPVETPDETPAGKPTESTADASAITATRADEADGLSASPHIERVRVAVGDFLRDEVRARPLGFVVDIASLALVAWALWWFADNDGGLRTTDLRQFSILALLLTPFLADELRRSPRPVRIALVALPIGALLSFAFAVERSRFVADALTFGSVPVLVLVGARLARRRWTVGAVLAIVVMGFASWSWLAGLKWWGWSDLGAQPRWDLLSWRNQSGILTAAFGVWLGGICLAGRRSPSLIAGGAVGLAMAGAWLSTSRAAPLFGALGLLLVAGLWIASSPDRHGTTVSVVGRLLGIVATTVALVAALQLMLPAAATTPLESRGTETVSGNAITRTKHWEAAMGMFTERPVTGTGIGSYRGVVERFNPPDGRLTAAAHSAWFEGLGEGGLVFGLPLMALGALAAVGTLRLPGRLRPGLPHPDEDESFGLVPATIVGGVAAGATVIAHASVDFNFRYETLLAVACLGGGFVLASWLREDEGDPAEPAAARNTTTTSRPVAALMAPMLLVGAGLWGAAVEARPLPDVSANSAALIDAYAPWDTSKRIFVSNLLARRGDADAAIAAMEPAVAWNPGDPAAQLGLARAQYRAGHITGEELVALLEPAPTKLSQWSQTAEALLEGGDLRQAEIAARGAIAFFPEYRVWGIATTVSRAWQVLIEIGTLAQGCDEGRQLLDEAIAQGFDTNGFFIDRLEEWFSSELCPAA